jgi:hypothetical protein
MLKEQLKSEANRHSKKLISKLSQIVELPDCAKDSIRQEVLYSTMDGYRVTMKNRNGGSVNDKEINGNK